MARMRLTPWKITNGFGVQGSFLSWNYLNKKMGKVNILYDGLPKIACICQRTVSTNPGDGSFEGLFDARVYWPMMIQQ